jgi:type VI secretion system protein ImpG
MKSLVPHFERELTFLRERASGFARAYPKIAARLELSDGVSSDPHAERMIESFALLAARIHKRLDDDFSLFTESMLEVLYPHYLRPFPSCSVARFDQGAAAGQLTRAITVGRGTSLQSRPVKGVACRFRTTQDVTLLPLVVQSAIYRNAVKAPPGTSLPAGVTSVLSVRLSLSSPQSAWPDVLTRPLRFYLDGEPSLVVALREALCRNVASMMVQWGDHGVWQSMASAARPQQAGFDPDEPLVAFDARTHDAYRLLTEYFVFPEKFNFVDLPVSPPPRAVSDAGEFDAPTLTIHLLMKGIRSDSDASRLLEMSSERNFLLGCTPVVNLFEQHADPIRITQQTVSYPVVVDSRRAFAYEVHTIRKVFRVRKTAEGEAVEAFGPMFSFRHGDDEADDEGAPRCYWHVRRDEDLAEQSPGYETELTLVDHAFNPATPQIDTLSLTVLATNRDLPSLLPFGLQGGDLFMEGGGPAREIRLLRKPTASVRLHRHGAMLWRLISHLSLNHLSLASGGVEGLREMLGLYDFARASGVRGMIDGLEDLRCRDATAWLPGEPFASFVKGTEIQLFVDEERFVGVGLGLFAEVLDRFFGLYAHANSFTQLTVLAARTQEVLVSCPPRSGSQRLV